MQELKGCLEQKSKKDQVQSPPTCLLIIASSVLGVTEMRDGEVPSDKTCGYGFAPL